MKKLKLMLLPVLMFCSIVATAQQANVTPVQIGDFVPGNTKIDTIVNDKYTSAHISDFKDQLLILDFWFIGCSACIEALPKAVTLPPQFGGRVKILPVTSQDSRKQVADFMSVAGGHDWGHYLHGITNIPSVAGDKILAKLFPHVTSPYEIWIFKGKVVAITGADYVTGANIQYILDHEGKNDWPAEDNMVSTPLDAKKPLLQLNMSQFGPNPRLRHYAAVFGYQNNTPVHMGSAFDPVTRLRRTYFINLPIINAYVINIGKTIDSILALPDPSHVLLEVKDKSNYIRTDLNAPYVRKAYISYESICTDSAMTKKEQGEMIIRDLDNLLGIHARYENRKVKCLALVRTGTDEKLKTAGGKNILETSDGHVKLRNYPPGAIIWQINQKYGNPPVFDETDYKGHVDLDLNLASWADIEGLRRALQPYGLDLKEEEKEVQMFVITETGNKGN
jgi:hypothetical protein